MASSFNKFQDFAEQVLKGVHNLDTHALKVMFTNSAPVATNTVFGDLTEITAQNGYSSGGLSLDNNVVSETGGTAKLVIDDEVFTATGGSVGPFRYVVLYNDTAASDPLIGWYDYGSALTLADGESITIDFDGTNGVLTLA